MPSLVLRLQSPASFDEEGWGVRCEWLVLDDDGSVRGQGETDYQGLSEVADPNQRWVADPRNVLVLVPNDRVLEVSATVPGRSTGQIRRALPYAVEEYIATDIERMHVAHGTIRAGQPVACQLIERDLLKDWVACLQSLGIQPGHFVADAHLLNPEPGSAAVLLDGDTALVRAAGQAATLDRANLLFALQSLEIDHVSVANGRLTDIEVAQLDGATVEHDDVENESSIAYLANLWSGRTDINLLQGDFTPPRAPSPANRGWRMVAGLAGVWIVVGWLAMVAEGLWAERQAAALDAEAREIYGRYFPGETRVRNVQRALAGKIGGGPSDDGGAGFLHLSEDVAAVLPREGGVRALDFQADRSELKTEVLLEGFAEVEQLQQQLEARGVSAELQNSLQEDEQVRAYLVLRRGGGGS